MKNEINQTVEHILGLEDLADEENDFMKWSAFRPSQLKALATAYTQLKADLATARQGLEHYADICSTCLSPRDTHDENGQVDMLDEIGRMICGKPEYPAQQTLDKIGKE